MRRSTRSGVLLIGAIAALSTPVRAQDDRAIVERVRDYIDRFEQEVSALVAEEHYVQRLERRISASRIHSTRELRSDYVLVKPADSLAWIGYRDVFEVDGTPVRERDSRVVDILGTTAPDSHNRAAAFALEGARFNLGPARTINVPTMPMQLAGRQHAGRIALRVGRVDRGKGIAVLRLVEPNRPTLVRTPDGTDVLTSGELTIRIADGAIVAATLSFRFPGSRMREASTMAVEYGDVEGIPVPVPLRMTEALPMDDGQASGVAEYSNYRRFQTSARIR